VMKSLLKEPLAETKVVSEEAMVVEPMADNPLLYLWVMLALRVPRTL
jgi:hypothetical protein